MELIIKPTSKCNFNCSFCSAKMLNIKHSENVSEKLKNIIKTLQPDNIIFTGGDPLMVSPEYYEEILSLGNFSISMTTNLKDFYLHPDKWTNLFLNDRVGIGTSFHYGDSRKWSIEKPYTEEKFIEVMNLFNDRIGYMPTFISIISEENEDRALDHIYLAKRLNTRCKLNGLLPLGLSTNYYPLYKMIDIWCSIIDNHLEQYWDSEIQFYTGGCNFNTNLMCESNIRTFWLNDKEEIQYGNCEDCASMGQRIEIDTQRPRIEPKKLDISQLLRKECVYCPLCKMCNACKSLKKINEMTENHCEEMRKRLEKIEKMGWKL